MKTEIIFNLTKDFEFFVNYTEEKIEFWFARDLQQLLGYEEWRNFKNTIIKAKMACEISGELVKNHFVDVNKMVEIGSGVARNVEDIMLTRYAYYIIKSQRFCYRNYNLQCQKKRYGL